MEQTLSFNEAIAAQPAWVGLWLNVLLLGAFVAPLTLLIWKSTRRAGLITFVASALSGVAIQLMYNAMGYVKLLGLPHIIAWVPVIYLLLGVRKQDATPNIARWIIVGIVAAMGISLVFDVTDVVRYVLGERDPSI